MARERKLDTDTFKSMLEEEKERLERQIKHLEDRVSGRDPLNSEIASRDFDELGGDAARDTAERGQAAAVSDSLREILNAVETALHKIEVNTYGVCDRCNKNIPKSRLEFLPYATMCAKCRREISS